MKIIFVALFFSLAGFNANAGVIKVDTANWLKLAAPSNDRNTGTWVGLHSQSPEKKGNSSGALVSDFTLSGDFLFSGFMTPTIVEFDDNDIIGLVFGWQDPQNHFRLGWSQTQRPGTDDDNSLKDVTGRAGLFLIQEIDGTSNTLFNINDWFWQDDVRYGFEVSWHNNLLNVVLGAKSFSIKDLDSVDGRVGVYTESQTAKFGALSVNQAVSVPEPGAIVFLSGIFLLMASSRKSRRQA